MSIFSRKTSINVLLIFINFILLTIIGRVVIADETLSIILEQSIYLYYYESDDSFLDVGESQLYTFAPIPGEDITIVAYGLDDTAQTSISLFDNNQNLVATGTNNQVTEPSDDPDAPPQSEYITAIQHTANSRGLYYFEVKNESGKAGNIRTMLFVNDPFDTDLTLIDELNPLLPSKAFMVAGDPEREWVNELTGETLQGLRTEVDVLPIERIDRTPDVFLSHSTLSYLPDVVERLQPLTFKRWFNQEEQEIYLVNIRPIPEKETEETRAILDDIDYQTYNSNNFFFFEYLFSVGNGSDPIALDRGAGSCAGLADRIECVSGDPNLGREESSSGDETATESATTVAEETAQITIQGTVVTVTIDRTSTCTSFGGNSGLNVTIESVSGTSTRVCLPDRYIPASGTLETTGVTATSGTQNVCDGTPANDVIACTSGDDYIEAGAGDDAIFADAGNDDIFGEGGVDFIIAGDGDDNVDAGDDYDEVDGGAGNDTINLGADGGVAYGGTGTDTFVIDDTHQATSISATIIGGGTSADDGGGYTEDGEQDTFDFDGAPAGSINLFTESADRLDFSDFTGGGVTVDLTSIVGVGGLNIAISGSSTLPSTISGSADIDTFNLSTSTDSYTIDAGADNDQIDTGSGSDIIDGEEGDDTINSGNGDDTVTGGSGDDIIDGGIGTDTLDESAATTDMDVVLTNGNGSSTSTGQGNDTLTSIENINTGSGDDTFEINDSGNNIINADGGDDEATISGGSGIILVDRNGDVVDVTDSGGGIGTDEFTFVETINISGSAGNDIVVVTDENNNTITGNGGSDTVLTTKNTAVSGTVTIVRTGDDVNVSGTGFGIDQYNAISSVYVTGSTENDTFYLTDENDNTITGNGGTDIVNVSSTASDTDNETITVIRTVSNVSVVGDVGIGNDNYNDIDEVNITAGGGDDTFNIFDTLDNTFDGGDGIDTANYAPTTFDMTVSLDGSGSYTITGTGVGTDVLLNIENINTGSGNDTITVQDVSDNTIDGGGNTGGGNDVLTNVMEDGYSGLITIIRSPANIVTVSGPGFGTDIFTDIEQVNVTSVSGSDIFRPNDDQDNVFDAAGGTDWIDYSTVTGVNMVVDLSSTIGTATGDGNDSLIGFENISGSVGNDTLTGSDDANIINGNDGIDTINGGAGTDTIDGGDGDDTISGGADDDDIDGGAGTDTIDESSGVDDMIVVLSNITGVGYIENTATGEVDTLDNIENVNTGSGDDQFFISDSDDNIIDAGGEDSVGDIATAISGTGTITITRTVTGVTVSDGSGSGGIGRDQYIDVEFMNVSGSATDDTFVIDDDQDNVLDGGDGTDTISYEPLSTPITVTIVDNTASISATSGIGNDTLINIENIETGSGDDTFDITGTVDYGLNSNSGNDLFDFNGTVDGTLTLETSTSDTHLDFQDYTGTGVDIDLSITNVSQTIDTGLIVNLSGTFTSISGSDGADNISGTAFADTIWGGDDDDTLYGGAGTDKINGGDGDDTIDGGADNDDIDGGDGIDTIDESNSTDSTIVVLSNTTGVGSIENTVTGEIDTIDNIENVTTGSGDDTFIIDDSGANVLDGGDGDDTISYEPLSTPITVTIVGANATISGTGIGDDTLLNFENIETGSGDDLFDITGTVDYGLNSNSGNDIFDFNNAVDGTLTLETTTSDTHLDFQDYTGTGIDIDLSITNVSQTIDTGLIVNLSGTFTSISGSDSVDNISGTTLADTIWGGADDDTLYGNAGEDTIDGGDGDDTIDGGADDDTIDGGAGTDTVDESDSGTDPMIVILTNTSGSIENTATGEIDTLYNIENVNTADGNDQFFISDSDNNIIDANGETSATGDVATVTGGTGTITITRTVTGVTVDDGSGSGGIGRDQYIDVEFVNVSGSDTDDTFVVDDDQDNILDGGDGSDTISYEPLSTPITVTIVGNTASISATGTGDDTLINIENIETGSGDDTFNITGSGVNYGLNSNDGNDLFDFNGAIDGSLTIETSTSGTHLDFQGNDSAISIDLGLTNVSQTIDTGFVVNLSGTFNSISGTNYADNISGTAVADTIWGGLENDRIWGEDGDDFLYGEAGDDTIDGGAGVDTIDGGIGADTLSGGDDDDIINGGDDNDTLNGDAGADTLNGGDGIDTINGGDDDDIIDGGAGNDDIDGGDGTELIDESGNGTDPMIVVLSNITGVGYIQNTATGEIDAVDNIENVNTADGNDQFFISDSDDNIIDANGETSATGDVATVTGGTGTITITRTVTGVTVSDGSGSGGIGNDQYIDVEFVNVSGSDTDDTFVVDDDQDNVLDGGDGSDTISYEPLSTPITVTIVGNTASISATGTGDDTLISIENIETGSGDDYFDITGSGVNYGLNSNDGNDLFDFNGAIDGSLTIETSTSGTHLDFQDNDSAISIDLGLTNVSQTIDTNFFVNLSGTFNSISGTDYADNITGTAVADTIWGGDGGDTINGGDGDDIIDGGAGNDDIDGGDGTELIDESGNGTDPMIVVLSNITGVGYIQNTATGEIDALDNIENIYTSDGNDQFFISDSNDNIIDANGETSATGDVATVTGGTGTITITRTVTGVTVSDGSGSGGIGNDQYINIEFVNVSGSATDDTFVVDDDQDNVLDGGDGTDTISYEPLSTPITVTIVGNTASISATSGIGNDTLINIENIETGSGDDYFDITGTGVNYGLNSNDGNDIFDFASSIEGSLTLETSTSDTHLDFLDYTGSSSGISIDLGLTNVSQTIDTNFFVNLSGTFNSISGTDYADNISGTAVADTIWGGDGVDTINGGDGDDIIHGGAGNDDIDGGDGTELIDESGNGTNPMVVVLSNITGVGYIQNTATGEIDALDNIENIYTSDGDDQFFISDSDDNIIDANGETSATGDVATVTGGTGTITITRTVTGVTVSDGSGSGGIGNDQYINIEFVNVSGSATDDTFVVDDDQDNVLDGGDGTDTISYEPLSTPITVTIVGNTASISATGTGDDTLINIENIETGSGDDYFDITGSGVNYGLNSNDGNDLFDFNSSIDGSLTLETSTSGTHLDFQDYDSAISIDLGLTNVSQTIDTGLFVNLSGTFNSISGTDYADNITGTAVADTIWGGDGVDTINGGDGDDIIEGGAGNDDIDGGAGIELIDESGNGTNPMVVVLSNITGVGYIENTVTGEIDTVDNIENVYTSDGNDQFFISDSDDNIIDANGETSATGDVATVTGGTGTITITRTVTGVTVSDGSGSGGIGNDQYIDVEFVNVSGSSTDDTFVVDDDQDNVLDGGDGSDTISYEPLSTPITVTIVGNQASISATSGIGDDTLINIENIFTGTGDDYFDITGSGVNYGLNSNSGNDIFDFNNTVDGSLLLATSASGTHLDFNNFTGTGISIDLSLTNVSQTIDTNFIVNLSGTFNSISGSIYADNITGTALADTIWGGNGVDTINGGDGDDIIDGGDGNDDIDGGDGTEFIDESDNGTDSMIVVLSNITGVGYIENTVTGEIDTVDNIENITTSEGDDTFSIGDSDANIIDAASGTDTLTILNAVSITISRNVSGDITVTDHSTTVGNDSYLNVEQVNVSGTSGDDTFIMDDELDNIIDGQGGTSNKVDYSLVTAVINVNVLSAGTTITSTGIGNDTIINIQDITTGDEDDIFIIEENSEDNVLDGDDGNDTATYTAAGTISATNSSSSILIQVSGSDTDQLDNFETVNFVGSTGDDTFLINDSNDNTIDGSSESTGGDTYDTSFTNGSILVTISDTVTAVGTAIGTDTLVDIENIVTGDGADTFVINTDVAGTYFLDAGATLGNTFEFVGSGAAEVYVTIQSDGTNDLLDFSEFENAIDIDLSDTTTEQTVATNLYITFDSFIDDVIGTDYDDTITGNSGLNNISGGAGNDTINISGTAGADVIDGGTGDDTVNYLTASDAISATIGSGGMSVQISGTSDVQTITNVENISGTNNDDTFYISGAVSTTINAQGGTDAVDYSGLGDAINVDLSTGVGNVSGTSSSDDHTLQDVEDVMGSLYDDNIVGNDSNNTLSGNNGDDIIQGNGGDDTIDGGSGSDTVSYVDATIAGVNVDLDAGSSSSKGGGSEGSDTLTSIENVSGSDFFDTISGSSGSNVLYGNGGADEIYGGAGADEIYGGEGNDVIYGDEGNDVIYGGSLDAVSGTSDDGSDTIEGGDDNDTIYGGNNNTGGGTGNDNSDGGNDNIEGNGGDDTIYGGNNNTDGGSGDDGDDIISDINPSSSGGNPNDTDTVYGDNNNTNGGSGNAGTDTINVADSDNNDEVFGDNNNTSGGTGADDGNLTTEITEDGGDSGDEGNNP
jgi:Ca2+-binding RTX toxin-like protein